ncbi:MAG: pyruvate ferredoxin oxidoreductase [Elusimicrobia bacterium]|nr:pyruvate ferredoxin oxidoreductase [Elusimicrobiota bacterium]
MPVQRDELKSAQLLTGNQAAAQAAYLCRVQAVSAYPITPQTAIIESLAEKMVKASWPHRFIKVESEHSALASMIGAAAAGARTFTATSSQGLLLMHELLHWASGSRLPIVMVNVNRGVAAPWILWSDQQDSLSQRDTGWVQIYCGTAQETLDGLVMSYKLAESVQVPVMLVLEAFTLSHTAEAVHVPDQADVDAFLPPRKARYRLDPERPQAFGAMVQPELYQKLRQKLDQDLKKCLKTWQGLNNEWQSRFHRSLGAVETFHMTPDAEAAILVSGAVAQTARYAVRRLREKGVPVGLVTVRFFRPFPSELLRTILSGVKKVAVLDRAFSWGHRGIWMESAQSSLYSLAPEKRPALFGYVLGLGGGDINPETIEGILRETLSRQKPDPETVWVGANA